MWRVCDLFEAVPIKRCEGLGFKSLGRIQTSMRAALPATDRARASISMIGAPGECTIQVAFERDAIREPSHEMGCKRAMKILRAVSTGLMPIIEGDFAGSVSRWIGAPGCMYKVSEIPFYFTR
jgi:hypothetical protein